MSYKMREGGGLATPKQKVGVVGRVTWLLVYRGMDRLKCRQFKVPARITVSKISHSRLSVDGWRSFRIHRTTAAAIVAAEPTTSPKNSFRATSASWNQHIVHIQYRYLRSGFDSFKSASSMRPRSWCSYAMRRRV